jgi:DNA repair exonuclease SbcCD ATPase subunit
MIIDRVKLHNFMNVSECDIAFNEGINVIGGRNGQGKSTIFAAIAFPLGGYKRGDSWKDFIKIGTDKMTIEISLRKFKEDEPMVFYIEGSSNSSSMVREIRYKNEYARNSECDIFISKYFDIDMMENILFHLQESVSIVNITPSKRSAILKKIFNSDFTDIVSNIKEDISKLKTYNVQNSSKLEILNNTKFLYKELDSIPEISIEGIELEIDTLNTVITNLNDIISKKKLELDSFEKEKNILKEKEIKINAEINTINNLIRDSEKYLEENSIEKIEKELIEYKKSKEEIETFIQSVEKPLKEKQEKILNLKEVERKSFQHLTETNSSIKNLQKQLEVFDTNSICPTCGQTCDIKHKQTLLSEIEAFQKIASSYSEEYKKVKIDLASEEESLRSLSKDKSNKETELALIIGNISAGEREKVSLEKNLEFRKNILDTNKLKISELEKERNNVKNSLEVFKDEGILNLKQEIEFNNISLKQTQSEIQEKQNIIKQIETLLLLNKEKEKYNAETRISEEATKAEIIKLQNEIKENQEDITDLDYVKTVYDSELPTHIMSKACSFLEKEINYFLNNTKEQFNIKLVQSNKGIDFFYKARNEPDWIKGKMASGFESALLTLAFKFSVALAYDTKFIIFDEPDKAADTESSIQLIKTITGVEGFNQIFITTHNPKALTYLEENGANVITVNNGIYTN